MPEINSEFTGTFGNVSENTSYYFTLVQYKRSNGGLCMQHILAGIRPEGNFTIAGYVNALLPLVELQDHFRDKSYCVGIADTEELAYSPPSRVTENRIRTARACLAAGIEPSATSMYLQSQLSPEISSLASLLERNITANELAAIPHFDHIKNNDLSRLRVPVVFAANLAVQDTTHIIIDKARQSQLHVARSLIHAFNGPGNIRSALLNSPSEILQTEIEVMSLDGKGRMTESNPKGAVFLNKKIGHITPQIHSARTTRGGKLDDPLIMSYFAVSERLAQQRSTKAEIKRLRDAHLAGGAVLGDLKTLMADTFVTFIAGWQERIASISDAEVKQVLYDGSEAVRERATVVLKRVHKAAGYVPERLWREE